MWLLDEMASRRAELIAQVNSEDDDTRADALYKLVDLLTKERLQGEEADVCAAFVPHMGSKRWGFEAAEACLHLFESGVLPAGILDQQAPKLVEIYDRFAARLFPKQRADGFAWMWDDEQYRSDRFHARSFLDLMGFFGTNETKVRLRDAMGFTDPVLLLCASTSLLRIGERPSEEALARAAASFESRWFMFERLRDMDLMHLFPGKYMTQEALAETDMVNWLIFPTELDRAPDEIELMNEFDINCPEGPATVYLFRFRVHEPHWSAKNGWMAGIAGPYVKSQIPTSRSLGGTFSQFEAWESKTPREHLEELLE